MKALTLAPDWGMLMLQGDKTIDYRTWRTNYRGDVLICTSAKRIRGCISGHGILIAKLCDCVPFKKCHLDAAAMDRMPDGGFAWLFDDFRLIRPIPVKGKLGLFDVDASNLQIVPSDLPESEADNFVEQFIIPLIFQPVRQ